MLSVSTAIDFSNFKECSVTHCISHDLCGTVLYVVSSTLSGLNSLVSCSSLLKVIKDSIKIKKLFVCSFSLVHESVTNNLTRCTKTERYLSHFVLLNSELFSHSNECFCLFVILYIMFLITAPSPAHIYHLYFGTSQGMLTVQQRILLLNSSTA